MYQIGYYHPSKHFLKRCKSRMSETLSSPTAREFLLKASEKELAKRANFMLLFSIHGRPGNEPDTEVRFYFDWNIIISTTNRTLITMYQDKRRKMPPIRLFGDKYIRKQIYNLWFRKNSAIRNQLREENLLAI